jgi:Arc/MetJ family transcription regulator
MARTTLDIDEKLISDARELTGAASKKAAIEEAIREYIKMRRRQEFAEAIRRGEFNLDLTPEELKEMRKPRKSLDVSG